MKRFITAGGTIYDGIKLSTDDEETMAELVKVLDENKYKRSNETAAKIMAGFNISQRIEVDVDKILAEFTLAETIEG